MEGEIYIAAEKYKKALLDRERAAAVRLRDIYGHAWGRLKRQLDLLTKQIVEARRRGELVNQSWLYRQERYQSLLFQLTKELARFAEIAKTEITKEQRTALKAGLRDSQALMGISVQDASISSSFNRVNFSAVEYMAGFAGNGSPLSARLDRYGRAAKTKVEKFLLEGVTQGHGPKKIADNIRNAMGGGKKNDAGYKYEFLRLARTEVGRAYRAASLATYRQNRDLGGQYEWVSSKSAKTCAACLALDGQRFDLAVPFRQHVNCIPAGALIHAPDVQASTGRWYEGELVVFETVSGNKLSVTPNHPILTARGWVAAGLLNEADHVISALLPERVMSTVNPDKQYVPSRIEQIFRASTENSSVVSMDMPAAPEDFHGDGKGSQVQVVSMHGLLRNGVDAAVSQPLAEQNLVGRHSQETSLASSRPPYPLVDRLDSVSGCQMCGRSIGASLLGSAPRCHKAISGSRVSPRNASFQQASAYDLSGYSERSGDGVFRFARGVSPRDVFNREIMRSMVVPKFDSGLNDETSNHSIDNPIGAAQLRASLAGLVSFDKIRVIRREFFTGQVYNLQTSTGWYIANKIITHNCRCTLIFVLDDYPPPVRQTGAEWFAKQPAKTQKQILGSDLAYQSFRSGALSLQDFVGRKDSIQWGTSYYQLSAKRALNGEGRFPASDQSSQIIPPSLLSFP